MKKEILTLDNVQQDIQSLIKTKLLGMSISVLLFVVLFIPFIAVVGMEGPLFFKLVIAFPPLLFLTEILVIVFNCIRLYNLLKNTDIIVRDRLVGMEEKDHRTKRRFYTTYHLYFASYGMFKFPCENYSWSELYYMSDQMAYIYSECDDEFYLVLSKPHTGKIVLAYNTKMFELQEG